MTDWNDPDTVNTDEVIANIENSYRQRYGLWDDHLLWPNITVLALARRIQALEAEKDEQTDYRHLFAKFIDYLNDASYDGPHIYEVDTDDEAPLMYFSRLEWDTLLMLKKKSSIYRLQKELDRKVAEINALQDQIDELK